MKTIPELDWRRIDLLIALALEEDLQDRGDVTTKSVIGENLRVKAVFLAKEDCVCAGLPVAKRIMKEVDPEAKNLVNKIRQLDELRKAGKISNTDYTRLRQKAIRRYKG